jgi:hypothetical protein
MALSKILIGLILLLALCAWAEYSCPYPDLAEILANPEKFSGRRVAVFIEAKVAEHTKSGFILDQHGRRLRVHTTIKDSPIGEFVAVAGVFQPPADLQADTIHLGRARRWKIAVSIIPVLVLAVFLPRAIRFDRSYRTLTLRAAPHA